MPWIVSESRLSSKQKGSMPRAGLHEHVFCLNTSVADFVHRSGKLFVGFVDLKDAFGSLDHEIMLRELRSIGLPDQYLQLTKAIYDCSTFQVKTHRGITAPIERRKGIIQGCPYSVLCFEVAIDKWLRWIDIPAQISPTPVQGYVDDVCYAETNLDKFTEMTSKTEMFLNHTGMTAKHRKCAVSQAQRSGNNWKEVQQCEIMLQNDIMPVLQKEESYPYLGHDFFLDNKCNKQTAELISEFKDDLKTLDITLLPTSAKLEAVNTVYLPKVTFFFTSLMFTVKELSEIEDTIIFYARHWLKMNTSSTRSYFFTPKSEGGIGMINPSVMFNGKFMGFKIAALNSDDQHVRATARESLKLHMSRRKVRVSEDPEHSFAGYMVEDGKLVKDSKIHFPRSQWCFLFELCNREHIILRYNEENDMYFYAFTIEENVTASISNSKAFYIVFKNMKLGVFLNEWKNKSSQGRVRKSIDNVVDHKFSSTFLNNHKLSDDIRSFVCRGRLQILQCNSILHLYYNADRSCNLCNHPSETVSHILNGCKQLKDMYTKRHNRLVDLIYEKIPSQHNMSIIKDKTLTPSDFNDSSESFITTHRRPDITVIDTETRQVFLVEIAVPFDTFIGETYQNKFEKYLPLSRGN